MASLTANQELAVPAAILFLDSLGVTLPFKSAFSYKELSDFCAREGLTTLAAVDDQALQTIATLITTATHGHVRVAAAPIQQTGGRTPIADVDVRVASTFVPILGNTPPKLGDRVILKSGANIHVVELGRTHLTGIDDRFANHTFQAEDIQATFPLTSQRHAAVSSGCPECGEALTIDGCTVCGFGSPNAS